MLECALGSFALAGAALAFAPFGATRYRVATLAIVVGALLSLRAVFPEPTTRHSAQAALTLTLGYGHVLGAFVFGRRKLIARLPDRVPKWLSAGTLVAGLAALLSLLPAALPREATGPYAFCFFLATQLLNDWHTLENDWLLARSYENGMELGPVSRRWTTHWKVTRSTLGLLALTAGVAFAPAAQSLPVAFADVFSAAVLYHIVGFLLHFADRAVAERCPSLGLQVLAAHLPPALLSLVLLLPGPTWLEGLRAVYLNASLFLFLNGVHVVQTVATRGLARR